MAGRTRRLLVALIFINFGLLTSLMDRPRLCFAQESILMLRDRASMIVDERGKVRAKRKASTDERNKPSNGDPYPEMVLLRLVSRNGRPSVRLGMDVQGTGVYLEAPRTRPWPHYRELTEAEVE
jgi:hypothetical protein